MTNDEVPPGSKHKPRYWGLGSFDAQQPSTAPLKRPDPAWRLAFFSANAGIYAALMAPVQILIGLQAAAMAPQHKELVLSVVTGFGAFAAMVANPILGALSDRTFSRYGRRMPWVLWGTVAGVLGLISLSVARTTTGMVISWMLVQIALNGAFAALKATPNDTVDIHHRAEMGGWFTVGQHLGALVGIGCAVWLDNINLAYLTCATLLSISVVPYIFHANDRYLDSPREAITAGQFLRRFWVSPRQYPDFTKTWVSRFFVMLPMGFITVYLLYYLSDVVKYPHPQTGVFILLAIYVVLTLVVSFISGFVADYVGRYRHLILLSTLIMTISLAVLAFWQTWNGALVATICLGIGNGLFLALDFAISTRVLPQTNDSARDLGLINITDTLPQVLVPLLAGTILAFSSSHAFAYMLLFAINGAMFLLGGFLILRVKSVP